MIKFLKKYTSTFFRLGFTAWLIYKCYPETGPFTVFLLSLIAIGSEVNDWRLSKAFDCIGMHTGCIEGHTKTLGYLLDRELKQPPPDKEVRLV